MRRSAKFWIGAAMFQVLFGLAVFAATREAYVPDSGRGSIGSIATLGTSVISLNPMVKSIAVPFRSSVSSQSMIDDPIAVSRQADEFFTNRQYGRAADLYEQLLRVDPKNVNTYNNLGLTLHYLGRSTIALEKLNEGVVVDPTYQRIWLTLGYVNSQLGRIEQARTALVTATQIDGGNAIGQSAKEMLENLP